MSLFRGIKNTTKINEEAQHFAESVKAGANPRTALLTSQTSVTGMNFLQNAVTYTQALDPDLATTKKSMKGTSVGTLLGGVAATAMEFYLTYYATRDFYDSESEALGYTAARAFTTTGATFIAGQASSAGHKGAARGMHLVALLATTYNAGLISLAQLESLKKEDLEELNARLTEQEGARAESASKAYDIRRKPLLEQIERNEGNIQKIYDKYLNTDGAQAARDNAKSALDEAQVNLEEAKSNLRELGIRKRASFAFYKVDMKQAWIDAGNTGVFSEGSPADRQVVIDQVLERSVIIANETLTFRAIAERYGFDPQHVGSDEDGDLENDVHYKAIVTDNVSTKEQLDIEESVALAAFYKAQSTFEQRQGALDALIATGLKDVTLDAVDAQRIEDFEQSNYNANKEIEGIDAEENNAASLHQSTIDGLKQDIAALEREMQESNENVFQALSSFGVTQDGFLSLGSGFMVGALSMLAGVQFNKAYNNSAVSKAARQASILDNVDAGHVITELSRNKSFSDPWFVSVNAPFIKSLAGTLSTPGAVRDMHATLITNEFKAYREALEEAQRTWKPKDSVDGKPPNWKNAFNRLNEAEINAIAAINKLNKTQLEAKYGELAKGFGHAKMAGTVQNLSEDANKVVRNAVVEGVDDIASAARPASRLGGKLLAKVPVVGLGLTATFTYTTEMVYADSLNYIDELEATDPLINSAQAAALKKAVSEAYTVVQGDNAVSAAISVVPNPLSLPSIAAIPVVEWSAYRTINTAVRDHAPHLNQSQIFRLSQGMITPKSPRSAMDDSVSAYMPLEVDGHPVELHDAIRANAERFQIVKNMPKTGYQLTPNQEGEQEQRELLDRNHIAFVEADRKYQIEVAKLANDPQAMQAYLTIVPLNLRLDLAESLARVQANKSHPEVKDYRVLGVEKLSSTMAGYDVNVDARLSKLVQASKDHQEIIKGFSDALSGQGAWQMKEELERNKTEILREVDRIQSDPNLKPLLRNFIPLEMRLEALHKDPSVDVHSFIAAGHPELQKYLRFSQHEWYPSSERRFDLKTWFKSFASPETAAFEQNPETLNNFLLERYGIIESAPQKNDREVVLVQAQKPEMIN